MLPLIFCIPGTPPSGNRLTRMHWAARARLEREWGKKLLFYAFFSWREELERGDGWGTWSKKILMTITWSAPHPPDKDNALEALKGTVTDHLKRRRRKRVGGKMIEIPGLIPILEDDDPDHLETIYRPIKARSRRLEIILEEAR